MSGPTHYGKGDRYRPVDKKKFDENWERIFMYRTNRCVLTAKVDPDCASCQFVRCYYHHNYEGPRY
jgi:hypothetical protein